ncbi:MAG: hypothetical protein CVV05_00665 [Gammaproteobacteria bacterium HGW-Gammaproteobacteria-1]|jgi:hypothetical protein|nr:MAG: hypothetical protein CVV05_00665 [Gammaproteobacteria bacterium HGW-Gammaproteobacteria-1]
MAYPVHIGGKRFLTELVWRDLGAQDKKERRQEIRQLLTELTGSLRSVAFGYIQTGTDGVGTAARIGVINEAASPFAKPPGTPILAATLAARNEDGIYLLDLGDKGQYWYCAIQDGLIEPGSDVFFDADATNAELDDHLALMEFALPLYTNAGDLDLDPNTKIAEVKSFDLDAAVAVTKPPQAIRIHGANYRAVAMGLGLFAVIEAGLLLGPSLTQNKPEPPPVREFSPAELRELQTREFIETINSKYNTDGLFAHPSWVLHAFDSINDMSARLPGWAFDEGRCTPAKGCRFTWSESPLASTKLMREVLDTGIGKLEVDAATRRVSLFQMGASLWPSLGADMVFSLDRITSIPNYKIAQAVLADYCRQWAALSENAKCTFKDPENISGGSVPELQGFSYWSVAIENTEPGALLHLVQDAAGVGLNISGLTYAPIKGGASYWKAEVAYVAKE